MSVLQTCKVQDQRGLTLLNLLVSLAIVAILVAVGVPTFSNIVDNSKRKTAIYRTMSMLNFARDSAVHMSSQVVLCSTSTGDSCDSKKSWNDKILVFVDTNKNNERESNEDILQLFDFLNEGQSLHWKSFGNHAWLSFNAQGSTGYQSGRFYYCQNEGEELEDRGQVIVFRSGRSRIAQREEFKAGC